VVTCALHLTLASVKIYYRNSKTGETSRDIPTGSGSVVDSAIELNEPQPQQNGFPSAYDILRTRTSSSARAPAEIPSTWVKRLADDGISHYWYNTATGQAQWHEPSIDGPTVPAKITTPDEYEDEDAGYQALRKGFSNDIFTHSEMSEDILRRLSVYSDTSEAQSLSDATNLTHFLSNTHRNSAHQSATSLQLSPEALAERNSKDLQFHLAPKASETFSDLSVVVQRAINEIVEANPSSGGNDPAEAALVMDRVSAVVVAVRNLLYTSGTLAAPLSSLLPQTAEAAESSRSPMIELRPYQRKVTATLSKLVLSARATKSNIGTRNGSSPAFDARVDLDAAELDRAIMVLVSEIQRASAYGRAKRLHAVFDSPDGIGGVGLGNPGGGIGGHMKALGFVPGDDVIERLVLGRNLVEDLESFRTKVEDCLRPLENENSKPRSLSAHPVG
jgi:son of sevenless-like protein